MQAAEDAKAKARAAAALAALEDQGIEFMVPVLAGMAAPAREAVLPQVRTVCVADAALTAAVRPGS